MKQSGARARAKVGLQLFASMRIAGGCQQFFWARSVNPITVVGDV
jgi:hypothetical protein